MAAPKVELHWGIPANITKGTIPTNQPGQQPRRPLSVPAVAPSVVARIAVPDIAEDGVKEPQLSTLNTKKIEASSSDNVRTWRKNTGAVQRSLVRSMSTCGQREAPVPKNSSPRTPQHRSVFLHARAWDPTTAMPNSPSLIDPAASTTMHQRYSAQSQIRA
jgi:hypothetical protein